MRNDGKVGIRLRKPIFLNGQLRKSGSVIALKIKTAVQIIDAGLGRYTEEKSGKYLSR